MKKFPRLKKYQVICLVCLASYLIFAQSCMTMRTSAKETRTFFSESKIPYLDSTITIDGQPLHYIETGNATFPTLVFIHGSPGSWDAYKDYLKDSLLLTKFRMISIDRPGFGYSDFKNSKSLAEQSTVLNLLLERLNKGTSMTLIGHSYGGPLIVKMAVDKPGAYKNLIILAGALDPDQEKPEKWRNSFSYFPLKYLLPGAFRPSNQELWKLKTELKLLKPNLKLLTCGVVIFHGTKDRFVPYENVRFMKEQFVNAASIEVNTLPEVDHFIPWSHFKPIRDRLLKLD